MSALRRWLREERTREVDTAAAARAAFRQGLRDTGGCQECGSRGPHLCFGAPDAAQERICAALTAMPGLRGFQGLGPNLIVEAACR